MNTNVVFVVLYIIGGVKLMKIILNKCFGGFGLSALAYLEYAKKKNVNIYCYKYSYSKNLYLRKCGQKDIIANNVDYYFTKDYGDVIANNKQIDWATHFYIDKDSSREDLDLINIVETLGEKANGRYACLEVVEIPDTLKNNYMIDEYDGIETLHQKVQEW